ncbi:MAG: hypothetical protein IPL52_00040 [Flavobacteriales bacterium]|nr:hypothetical protein [Flavobacteriales bacterium]
MMKVEQNDGSRKLARAWMLLCAMVAFALCSHKAATSSFTNDELQTSAYSERKRQRSVDHKMAYTNNHLLNSLLGMKQKLPLLRHRELPADCRT